jgi:hypothetical protein
MSIKAILAVCFGYGAGIWFFVLALRKRLQFERARGWLSTRGRILESTLCQQPGNEAMHFRVRYEFTVGERIEGSTPRIAGDWFWSGKQQADFVARYQPGQEVEVFYDARNPRQNCLDRTDSSGIAVLWIFAIGGPALASLILWLQFR